MKRYIIGNSWLLVAVSALLLTSCTHVLPNAKTPQSIAEAELLRKNGNALIKSGNPQEAVRVFDQLIALDPENPLAYDGKGVAFDYAGNHLAAQDIYKTALSLSPDSLSIKNNLAMSLLLNHQQEQAIALFEPLLEKSAANKSLNSTIRHNLALAYGISGQRKKATKLKLREMSEEQAEKKLSSYGEYISRNADELKGNKEKKNVKKSEHNIGFLTSPTTAPLASKKKPSPTPNDAPKDTAKPDSPPSFMGEPIMYEYPE